MADGNPRLMERLDLILKESSLDHEAFIVRMEAVATEFREQSNLFADLAAGRQTDPAVTRRLAGLRAAGPVRGHPSPVP